MWTRTRMERKVLDWYDKTSGTPMAADQVVAEKVTLAEATPLSKYRAAAMGSTFGFYPRNDRTVSALSARGHAWELVRRSTARGACTCRALRERGIAAASYDEKRPLRRQPDDHHFWSLMMLAVTTGGFLLVTWGATKVLFLFLQESPIP